MTVKLQAIDIGAVLRMRDYVRRDWLTTGSGKEGCGLAAFAWDAEGEKLAVALSEEGSDQCSSGRIAVFAMSYRPIMGMRLLGFTAEKPALPPTSAPDGAHLPHLLFPHEQPCSRALIVMRTS